LKDERRGAETRRERRRETQKVSMRAEVFCAGSYFFKKRSRRTGPFFTEVLPGFLRYLSSAGSAMQIGFHDEEWLDYGINRNRAQIR
jgi:hypothetical protein